MNRAKQRDQKGATDLAMAALDELEERRWADLTRGQEIMRELQTLTRSARRILRREARRILGKSVWGTQADAELSGLADVRAIVDHLPKPSKKEARFDLSFWFTNGTYSRRLFSPKVTVEGLLIRSWETIAQLRALRAAADAYTQTLAAEMAEPNTATPE